MGLRKKLRNRVGRFLEDGESARAVFVAATGVNPAFPGASLSATYRVVVVTERGVLLLHTRGFALGNPTELLGRLSFEEARIGPWRGILWATIELAGAPYRVHRRFRRDLEAARGALARHE